MDINIDFGLYIYHAVYCLLDAVKVYLALLYFVGFRKKKSKQGNWFLLLVPVLMVPVALIVPGDYISYFYLPIILLLMHLLLGIWNLKSFLIAIIVFVCIFELDFFVGALMKLFEDGPGMILGRDNLFCSVISSVVVWIAAMAAKHYDIAFYKKSFKNNKLFVGVEVFILFVNLSVMGTFFGILTENPSGNLRNVLLILAITLSLVLSIITLIFYSAIMNVKEYRLLHGMNQQLLEMQNEHFHKLKAIDKETRSFRHDVKNHMLVLKQLLESEQVEEAKGYMALITDKVSTMNFAFQCGSGIVDAILNEKNEICLNKDISLAVEGVIHAPMVIEDYDICTILANGLDNAIEACERQAEKHGNSLSEIKVCFGVFQDYLRIVIRNPLRSKTSLFTSKANKNEHGYGLENIRKSVEKNLGQLQIRQENHMFELDVLVKAFRVEME